MPNVFVESIGEEVSYPDEWSPEQISEHAVKNFPAPPVPVGIAGGLARAGRNVAGSIVETVAAIPETVSVLSGKLARTFPDAENDDVLDLAGGSERTHQFADWIRYQAEQIYPDPKNRPAGVAGFMTDTLPQGGGSMASMVFGGLGMRALKIPAALGTAAIGAAINGSSAFQKAVEGGADDETAFRVFMVNAIGGTTEAIPIAKWLAGNPVAHKLKRALIDGSEELAQEAFSQILENTVAGQTYDPERPWLAGAPEAGAAGFTLGTLASLVFSAVGGKRAALKGASQQAAAAGAPATAAVLEQTKPVVVTPEPEVVPATPSKVPPKVETHSAAEEAIEVERPEAATPATPPTPGVLTFEGNPITSESRADVRHAARIIEEVNAELGPVISRVVIQDLDETSAGIASAPRASAFDTVVIDPVRLGDSISNGLDLKEAVLQEVTHNLDGIAVKEQWDAQGRPGTFQSFWDEQHNAIASQMTPEQKAATEKAYGAKIGSDVNMAAEFVHLLLRGDFRGTVDASASSSISRFLTVLKEFWSRFAGKPTAVSQIAKDHVSRIESILKSRAPRPAPATVADVEVGKTIPADPAGVASAAPGPTTEGEIAAGAGASPASGSPDGTAQAVGEAAGGSPDQVIITAYQKVGEAMDRLQGVTDTDRDLARTQVLDGVMKRAVAYQATKGSMEGFAWQAVIKQQTVNALKSLQTKARSPEGGTVSLDAPLDGGGSVADTVAAEESEDKSEAIAATKRLMAGIPKAAQDVLTAAASGDRGWMVKYAKEAGITKQAVLSRLRAAQTLMRQAALNDPAAREALGFAPEDLINAAPPITTNYPAYREPKARDLSFRQKMVRFMRPGTWAVSGYLRMVAGKTKGPKAAALLNQLADRVDYYYDKKAEYLGYIEKKFFEITSALSKDEYAAVKMEVQLWAQTAQARDNGQTLAASWQVAEALLPTLSKPAQAIVAAIKAFGVFSGKVGRANNVHVKDGDVWRPFVDLGEKFWQRRFSNRVQEILADPDHSKLTGEYDKLVRQLHAHSPTRFKTLEATAQWLEENGASTLSNGDFFAGLELARGEKFPDSWYDYSLDGFMLNMESWANRTAQIEAFGQSIPGSTKDLWDTAVEQATSQHQPLGSDADGLAKRIKIFQDEVVDSNQAKWNDKLGNALASIATVRYLFSVMTSVRNVAQSGFAIGENLGWYRTFRAGNRGLWSAARAISTTKRLGRLVEPDIVSQAAAAGAVQRSLYLSSTTGIVHPSNSKIGRFTQFAMTPNQMVEQWTRGVSYVASQLWLRDATDNFNANPLSKASLRMLGQMQRWGLSRAERLAAMRLNIPVVGTPGQIKAAESESALAANKFFRAATREKLYGYRPDQVPVIFRSRYGKLLLQFQAWGAQRQRDIARNILAPAFYGEEIEIGPGIKLRTRDPWPLLKFIVGTIAGAALVNGIKEAIFDRRERNTTWEEILNALDDDEKRAMQLSINHIANDLTSTGAAGIIPDYLRIMKDSLTPGRQKNFINAPGLQLAVDITELIKDQIERGGDPDAILRDVRDRLLRTTPIVREMEDATLAYLLADTDMAKTKAARQNVTVARAKIRAWAKETDRDDVGQRKGGSSLKNPNSELYDSIQEALLIGDVAAAGTLINDATNYRADVKKLRAIESSMRARHPLQLPGMDKADAHEFMLWLEKRNPGEYARASETVQLYEMTKALVGLR